MLCEKGAEQQACDLYQAMKTDSAIKSPLVWTDPSFSLDDYDLVFLPGRHQKAVKQAIDSPALRKQLAKYFPKTQKPSRKTVAAICHWVLTLAEASSPDGESVLHGATTTALPGFIESSAFWGTRLFLGDYYRRMGRDRTAWKRL